MKTLTFDILDSGWRRQAQLVAVSSAAVSLNAVGACTMQFEVPSGNPALGPVLQPGAVVHAYLDEAYLMGGWVRLAMSKGPSVAQTVTVYVDGYEKILDEMIAYPLRGGVLSEQQVSTLAAEADVWTAQPAETVIKTVAIDSARHSGHPLTAAPDQRRGGPATTSLRMNQLSDKLWPVADAAGLLITVRQSGAGLVLDTPARGTVPVVLTEDSGVLAGWSWSRKAPEASRVIVGGPGEKADRKFFVVTDKAREAAWGRPVEVFRDARNSTDDATLLASMVADARETLAEKDTLAGLALEMSETGSWQYGVTYKLGDVVTVELPGGVSFTQPLKRIDLTYRAGEAVEVTPTVGDRADDPDILLNRNVAALARAARTDKAGR